ncbi:hypothetical protein B0H16DRAFT_1714745 [Mycena metata]|uniref:Uncharacterized protein n=1 Tax=Mycena metata TaxID=1033252 RepID=A0AAD7JTE1_9AGAR|nr:hypothetical protein B0H16DRAFT_1714745 [Mycena metata]
MSTQSPYGLAREPVIQVPIPDGHVVSLTVDICGSKVAVMVHLPDHFGRLFVYDWNQGSLLMELAGRYSVARFISYNVVLLGQSIPGTLELWAIQENVPAGIVDCPRISLMLSQLAELGQYIICKTPPPNREVIPTHQPTSQTLCALNNSSLNVFSL